MREETCASWVCDQVHMGRSGEGFGTVLMECRCTVDYPGDERHFGGNGELWFWGMGTTGPWTLENFASVLRNQFTIRILMCQPTDQNVDLSGDDQIQNPHYPDVQENSLTNEKFEAYTNANNANMNDLQFKLDNFQKNQQNFQEKFEQMQDDLLNQMRNFMQNLYDGSPGEEKGPEATTDTELPSTKDIQPLPVQEPPQDFDMHQLIEECSIKVSEKQKMEDTMFELVKISQENEFICIHDDIDDLIESALDFKLFLIDLNSQRFDKKEKEVKNVTEQPAKHGNRSIQSLQNFRVVHKSSISSNTSQISSIHSIAPVLSTKEPVHLLSMGYEHLSITTETESDEVTESNPENLLPIPSECEVALEDKKECDVPISENSPVCDNTDTFFDSKINDDILVYDDDFEDIEYVEALLSDPEIVSVEEENVETEEEEEVNFEDISQIQDFVLREKLLSIIRLIFYIESLNDNSTLDRVLNSFESDNSLLDNFSPEFKIFCDHSQETRSGNTTHANYSLPEYDSFCFEIEPDQERFLEDLLINDSILSHESSDSIFEDNLSISRPPPEPTYTETDAREEISVVMNDKDKDVYSSFIFVIFAKMFSLLSVESEDTIFDPGTKGILAGMVSYGFAEWAQQAPGLWRILNPSLVQTLDVKVDLELMACQMNGKFVERNKAMAKYLAKAKEQAALFKKFLIKNIPRNQNQKADVLSKLASVAFNHLTKEILVEVLNSKSVDVQENPSNEDRLVCGQRQSVVQKVILVSYVKMCRSAARKVQEGECEMHARARSVVAKIIMQGYYCPTTHGDTNEVGDKCDSCQIHVPVPKLLKTRLTSIMSLWSFYQWGLDILGPLPKGLSKLKFIIVSIDYFTKWIKGKPLAKTTVAHPQANGLVKRANKSLMHGLKARLGRERVSWVDELPNILWPYRMMLKTSNGETPFSLTYGIKVVIPIEIGIPTYRTIPFNKSQNEEEMRLNLDLSQERREMAAIWEAKYKKKWNNTTTKGFVPCHLK
nr:reverse transcriptase domain-containing protein [Tanacetum cinerariifolium]